MDESLWTAAGLGAVTGLRSMLALAWVSRELSDRPVPRRAGRLRRWLAEDTVAITLSGLALAELVADKLPGVPDRVAPGPLFGRLAIGALVGAVAAGAVGDDNGKLGAVAGAGGALAGAFVGWFLRREAVRATLLPDFAVALAEDAVAVSASLELGTRL